VNTRSAQIATAAVLVLSTAACGGHSASRRAADGGALAYARCLRSHGLRAWPDPGPGGVFDKTKLTTQALGAGIARIQAAQTACRRLAPNGGAPPSASQQAQAKAQALEFARCVRSHGVPRFPDPDSTGRIPDPASVGIDQGSPQFRRANQACGADRPPYIPSNSAYDTWAQTR
jgi:hypothetical protein